MTTTAGRRRGSGVLRLGWVVILGLGTLVTACRSTVSDPEHPGFRVLPGVAFEMASDAPDMPILDLRRPDEFDGPLGHIQRARNLPLEEIPERLVEIEWLQESTFLVYCRGWDDCGERAMRFFLAHGFADAVLLEGGIEEWLSDGYATVGRGAQGEGAPLPEADEGLRIPADAKSIGDPRHLPEPP